MVWTEDAVASEAVEAAHELDAVVPGEPPGSDRGRGAIRDRVHRALFGSEESTSTREPRRFGRYVVVDKLGEGAMGEVFRAIDPILEREVAVKCVHSRLAGDGDRGIGRLLREARSLARLDHPHVVRVFEAGIDDTQPWIAMELVDGTNLRQWLASERRTGAQIMRCLVEAGRGLAAAHEAGLVHRDFKPDNVLVDHGGRTKVGDFGLVRALLEPTVPSSPTSSLGSNVSGSGSQGALTRDGAVLGTPAYMPPEQLAGDSVDATGDQFAFCVTAWEALFGVRPFAGGDSMTLCAAILAGNLRKRRGGVRVPRAVERALRRGLSARPNERFASMDDLLRRLSPLRARGPVMVFGSALLTVGVASGFWRADDVMSCDRDAAESAHGGAWDEARKQAVESAIERSGLPYRTVTSTSVVAALDERTASWIAAWQSACTAASGKVESQAQIDRKLACLHTRRAETFATVRRLETGDVRSIAAGRDAIDRLGAIGSCDALDADAPAVAEDAAAVLDPLLAVGTALRLGGYPAAAVGPLQVAGIEGARLGAPSAAGQAAIELGHALRELGDIPGAVATWNRAVDLGVAASDERLQASAWFELTQIAANDQRDATRAREWLQHGSAVASRVSGPGGLVIEQELSAALTTGINAPAEALVAIEEIGRRWGEDAGVDVSARGVVDLAARHRAALLIDLGRWAEAAEEYRARITEDTARYGPGHPRVGDAWYGLGIALDRSGKVDGGEGAEAAYVRASEIWRAAWPQGHRDVGTVEIALGAIAHRKRDFDATGRHAEAAMAMYRKVIPNELDAAFGQAWTLKGVVEHRRGEYDAAARSHDEARRVYEATSGETSVNAALARSNAAEARLMGLPASDGSDGALQAIEHDVNKAMRVLEDAAGPDNALLGYPMKVAGLLHLHRGDSRSGIRDLEQACRLLGSADPVECAEIRVVVEGAEDMLGVHHAEAGPRGR